MTRDEHMKWCKNRALEELEFYRRTAPWQGAISMMSDLKKHPETKNHAGIKLTGTLLIAGLLKSYEQVKKHIEGFN